jgi:uncharacterized protein
MTSRKKKSTPRKKVSTGRKKTSTGRKKNSLTQAQKLSFAIGFLVVFVILALIVLTSLRQTLQISQDQPDVRQDIVKDIIIEELEPSPEPIPGQVLEQLKQQLIGHQAARQWQEPGQDGDIEHIQVDAVFPDENVLQAVMDHPDLSDHRLRLHTVPDERVIQVFWRHQLRLQLHYVPAVDEPSQLPRIAIIMDDLGASIRTLQRVLDLDLMLTPSILPGEARATASADFLRSAGREYMIHVPMQPRSYPQTNPGNNALLLSHSDDEIRRRMRKYMMQVPDAVGANNHMGSRFTEEAAPMQVVLAELQQQRLFFVDSLTISSSVALEEARRMGLKSSARDIFLDHYEDVDYIRSQIRAMVEMAKTRKQIIAICHPYAATFEAFRLEMDWLLAQPVEFVPVSRLMNSN